MNTTTIEFRRADVADLPAITHCYFAPQTALLSPLALNGGDVWPMIGYEKETRC